MTELVLCIPIPQEIHQVLAVDCIPKLVEAHGR